MDQETRNKSLSQCNPEELAEELASRPGLIRADGLLTPPLFKLRTKLGPIPCVDAIAIRRNQGILEGGLIRRNTGQYSGKLCLIGGVVAYQELACDAVYQQEDPKLAIKRHWKADVGVDVKVLDPLNLNRPVLVHQYCPYLEDEKLPSGFSHDAGKHSVGITFLVEMLSYETKFGLTYFGQEAKGFEWHTLAKCPLDEDFAYKMGPLFRKLMEIAEQEKYL